MRYGVLISDYRCGHQSTFWSLESLLNFIDLTRTGLAHLKPHPTVILLRIKIITRNKRRIKERIKILPGEKRRINGRIVSLPGVERRIKGRVERFPGVEREG